MLGRAQESLWYQRIPQRIRAAGIKPVIIGPGSSSSSPQSSASGLLMSARFHTAGLLILLFSPTVSLADQSLSSTSHLWRLEFGVDADAEAVDDQSSSGRPGHFMSAAIEKCSPDHRADDDTGPEQLSDSAEATSAWKMAGYYAAAHHSNSGSGGPTLVTLLVGFASVVVVCGTIFSRS